MVLKQKISVFVSSSEVVEYDATSDFTTDAIEWSDFKGYTLNVWFPILNGTGTPKLNIEVSNSDDVLSFKPLVNEVSVELSNLEIPKMWKMSSVESKYIRFIYTANGVGALSTVTFNLNKLTL